MSAKKPTRPALRWPGGKWRQAKQIIRHFPQHHVYVEPFGGAASVLLQKPRSYLEVYNDLDREVVTLFQVLRDPDMARELARLVELTPFARVEFDESYEDSEGLKPVEVARRLMARSFMGFSNAAAGRWRTGFRGNCRRSGTSAAVDWARMPAPLMLVAQRLRGVVIECRPALEVIQHYDGGDTLFYVDPPYPKGTRGRWSETAYRHEMTDKQHRALAKALHQVEGMVIISGYACALYEELYADWRCETHRAWADGARERTECLWISPNISARARQLNLGLFEGDNGR